MSERRKKLKNEKLRKKHLAQDTPADNHHKPLSETAVKGQVRISGAVEVSETQSSIEKHEAEYIESNSYKKTTQDFEESYLSATRLLLAVTTLYFIATAAILVQSWRSADAAKSAADTASRSLVETNRSFIEIRLNDGWKQPTDIIGKMEELGVPLTLTNIGKFPIKEVKMQGSAEVVNSTDEMSFHPADKHFSGKCVAFDGINILFPNRTADFPVARFSESGHTCEQTFPKLSAADKKGLADGSRYVMAFARGTFSDGFGRHWVEFCTPIFFVNTGGGHYGDCINYNDGGDGEPPWKEVWP